MLELLDETFEHVHGNYLDKGTSLFETLDGISAEVASRPISARCAPLSAQVEHVRFYLEVIEGHLLKRDVGKVDWQDIWQTVKTVTPEEWAASTQRLKATYQRVKALLETFETWEGENEIAGALAILTHTAYHLGEIRQGLGVLLPESPPTNAQ